MLNIKDTFATVFQPENKGKYTTANLSTGKKDKDGKWTNMSWRAKFVGKNQEISDRLRIKILSGTVESRKYEEKWYTDIIVFEWELIEKTEYSGQATSAGFAPVEASTDELPF